MTAVRLLLLLALPAFGQRPALSQERTMFPVVRGTRQMIGAGNSMEVEAGYRMLEQGGNAVDAGAACIGAALATLAIRFWTQRG